MAPLFSRCLQLLLLLLPLTVAVPAPATEVSARALIPLVPDSDSFYNPPAGFEATTPGTILRTRKIVSALVGLVPTGVTTYQLLYRTTTINGSAIAGVTTVFVPTNAKTDRFVSFHTAYDGSATICEPSYSYQLLSAQLGLISTLEFTIAELYMASGYIVSAPDYEGPDAAFGAGRLEGIVGLDSMRAVNNFRTTLGLTTSTPKIVVVGYSGGGIGAGWAASLQQSYAPELTSQILGWSLGGTPANLTGTFLFIDNTANSGFLPPFVDGLSKQSSYGAQLLPIINAIFTQHGQSLIDFARKNCILNLLHFSEMSLLSTKVQTLGDRLYYEPTIAAILKENTMGLIASETPQQPVLVYHATKDENVPYTNITTLVDAWCGYGANVNFITYAAGGHLTTEVFGLLSQYQFVQSAFAGTLNQVGCTRSTSFNNTLDPIAFALDLEPIIFKLVDTLGALQRGESDPSVLNQTIPT